jgi:hypothetical protein
MCFPLMAAAFEESFPRAFWLIFGAASGAICTRFLILFPARQLAE